MTTPNADKAQHTLTPADRQAVSNNLADLIQARVNANDPRVLKAKLRTCVKALKAALREMDRLGASDNDGTMGPNPTVELIKSALNCCWVPSDVLVEAGIESERKHKQAQEEFRATEAYKLASCINSIGNTLDTRQLSTLPIDQLRQIVAWLEAHRSKQK